MYAKAAAQISSKNFVPPNSLDSYDIKLIQFKYALHRLQELQRILGVLEKNLKNNEANKIIPLVNYILQLCAGPVFNATSTIRKRYNLLCEFKICKTNEINLALSTNLLNLNVELPEVLGMNDYKKMKDCIYNSNFQWELLGCLKKISQNSISIYNKKLRQLQLEKNSTMNRPYEVSAFKNKHINQVDFNTKVVEDLLRPIELSLSLDLAVLINDKEKDTSDKAFFKLQYQVMDKFSTYINKKVFPTLRQYYNQLQRYSNLIASNNIPNSKEMTDILPSWPYTFHRIYAFLLRTYSILSIMRNAVRQLYLSNRQLFTNDRIKLISKNICDYEEMIEKLNHFCEDAQTPEMDDLQLALEELSSNGTSYKILKNADSVTELFNKHVSTAVRLLRENLHTTRKWVDSWKYINEKSSMKSEFDKMDDDVLSKMLTEKRAVDKLTYVERNNKSNIENASKNFSSTSSSLNSSRSSSATLSPLLNSLSISNDDIKPIELRRKSSNSFNVKPMNNNVSPSAISRRSSVDRTSKAFTLGMTPLSMTSSPRHLNDASASNSNTNSPKISRTSSIIERQPVPSGTQSPNGSSNNTVKPPRKIVVRGRPRSTSLQSSFTQNKTLPKISVTQPYSADRSVKDAPRSNSLEATAALNRRLVQDAVKRSMIKDTTGNNSDRSISLYRSNNTSRNHSGSNLAVNNSYSDRAITPTKSSNKIGFATVSPLMKKKSGQTSSLDNDLTEEQFSSPQALQFKDIDSNDDEAHDNYDMDDDEVIMKKVRFTGVPPMTYSENPKPKRKGWYKKPSTLHYPPVPPQIKLLRHKLTQEGVVFRTSLRENYQDNTVETFENGIETDKSRKTTMFFNSDESVSNPFKESVGLRFASKIRDKLRS